MNMDATTMTTTLKKKLQLAKYKGLTLPCCTVVKLDEANYPG